MGCKSFLGLGFAACVLPLSGGALAAGGAALPDGSDSHFRQPLSASFDPVPKKPSHGERARFAPKPAPAGQVRLPYLSSRFGVRVDPLTGDERMHGGIDIPGALGSPILAADGGTVTFAGRDGGYGLMIEVDHGKGLRTRYGHLSRILVAVGSQVHRQETIGLMGSTGRSTGSHLHFEVIRNGRKENPVGFFGASAPPARFVPRQTAPFIEETAPIHISRFAQARAAHAQASGGGTCLMQDDRREDGCPG
jgi:murein DD-endopeptidase MepM/ murein hydrolase activator NlpD